MDKVVDDGFKARWDGDPHNPFLCIQGGKDRRIVIPFQDKFKITDLSTIHPIIAMRSLHIQPILYPLHLFPSRYYVMPQFMKRQWQMLHPDPKIVHDLTRHTGGDSLMARLLAIRGLDSGSKANQFLHPSFRSLTPPVKLAGMEIAVQRIHKALRDEENILVFGDYDVDGITATALLVSFLRRCGANVVYHIPHRISQGYGMGVEFIERKILTAGIDLIVTVDCGSGNDEAITRARKSGIDTIVTDHHPVTHPPEDAVAVVNPTQPACVGLLDHLAGVGVAFYLVIALRTRLRKAGFFNDRREPNLKRFCDLVALGTIADVSPLVMENRILTAAGLDQINGNSRPGIAALLDRIGASDKPVDAETIAFALAPHLNAAGRMAHAKMACELLLCQNKNRSQGLAGALCRLNRRRQIMENELLAAISKKWLDAGDLAGRSAIVVAGDRWHEGILGIVAARLTRMMHCPSVVISTRNGMGKGSGRSVEGIDLSMALAKCADLLTGFGGHPLAAGLSLPSSNITTFTRRMERIVDEMTSGRAIRPTLPIDAKLPIDAITPSLTDNIARLGPFGPKNPHPLFLDDSVRVHTSQTIGSCHRRMVLIKGSGHKMPAIQFNVTDDQLDTNRISKVVYRPQWNYWKGNKRLQLVIEDTASAL